MAGTWFAVLVILEPFIALLDAAILGVEADQTFAEFITIHGRNYAVDTQEYKLRHRLYTQRVAQVEQHNRKPEKRWTATVNEFADRTEAELAMLRGWRGLHRSTSGSSTDSGHQQGASPKGFFLSRSSTVLPKEVSWSNLRISQLNTDQGDCGSCWAVTTATVLTANAEIRGIGHNFSAQDIVDCVPNPYQCGGSGGCDGSTVEMAMNWIMEHGVKNMDQAPYLGRARACSTHALDAVSALQSAVSLEEMTRVGFHGPKSMNSPGVLLGLRGWEHLPTNKYLPLMTAVANTGPVAISVGASSSWYWYWGGIYDSCSRDAVINHAVTLIGYGEDADRGEKYWIIKNSWGLFWGENGNIRLLRTDQDESSCGVDTSPSEGTGCIGGPSEVTVCGMCGLLYDSVVPHFA